MSGTRILVDAVAALGAAIATALVIGAILQQPVLLGFVETGSMQPELDPGDGFIAIPSELAGTPQPGDIIVFRAETLNEGGYVTHRVVAVRDDGFVTKGDANARTDQAEGEPLVSPYQVTAVLGQIDGHPVVIPSLGTAATAIRGGLQRVSGVLGLSFGPRIVGTGLLVFAVALFALGGTEDRRRRVRSRIRAHSDVVSPELFVSVLVLGIVVIATVSMVTVSGPIKYEVVSAESDADRFGVIERGTTETITQRVPNGGFLPAVVVFDGSSPGVSLAKTIVSVPPRAARTMTVELSAPNEIGAYRLFVDQHRYFAVLPEETIVSIHQIHPWLAIAAVDAIIALPVWLLGMVTITVAGIDTRERTRSRQSVRTGLLRRLFPRQ